MTGLQTTGYIMLAWYAVLTVWWWWRTHDLIVVLQEDLPATSRLLFYTLLITWPVSMFLIPLYLRIRDRDQ